MPASEAFNALIRGLRKRAIRIGRVYQGQSIALIVLCRHLAENDTNPNFQVYGQLSHEPFLHN
jgi:hypothetical protein